MSITTKIAITLILIGLNFNGFWVNAQSPVSKIYTDHNGFLMSSTSAIQSPEPSSQNLLAFQTGTTIWSTGVNDATLVSNAVLFTPLNFQAMPATVVGVNANGVIGLGKNYGGYNGSNGCSPVVTLPFGNNASSYLTDGPQGLDISSGIFNIGGTINYTVSNLDDASIGDGIPDIIVTQIGDLNANLDLFRFKDASNNTVGNQISVNFSAVNGVMTPHWKFYKLSDLTCGASNAGTRVTRVLAFDLSDLGINQSNYANIAKFEHILTPNSDVAFIAYNTITATILPVSLIKFDAKLENSAVTLSWKTASETNSDYFLIERSQDGTTWEEVLTHKAANNSNTILSYIDYDTRPLIGGSYYRMKIVDFDGSYSTSNIVAINWIENDLTIFPNPADNILSIRGKFIDEVRVVDIAGKDVTHNTVLLSNSKTFVQLDVHNLTQGLYFIKCKDEVHQIVIK